MNHSNYLCYHSPFSLQNLKTQNNSPNNSYQLPTQVKKLDYKGAHLFSFLKELVYPQDLLFHKIKPLLHLSWFGLINQALILETD